jgi:hypothetical protein
MRGIAAVVVLLVLSASACAHKTGTEFDPSSVGQLVPGQSTLADATRLLGQPARTRSFAGGKVLARWTYVHTGESAALDIMFSDDGKMVSIVRRQ